MLSNPFPLPSNALLVEDDEPMTMQVGLIGVDGIVLASDTQWTFPVYSNRWNGKSIQDQEGGNKILTSGAVAVACAGKINSALEVGQQVLKEWTPEKEDAGANHLRSIVQPYCKDEGWECLIACASPEQMLLRALYSRSGENKVLSTKRVLSGRITGGDHLNAAKFWGLRYYDSALTVAQLKHLCAQFIIEAGKLNPALISGLQMVVSQGFGQFEEVDCEPFEREAKRRSDAIEEMMFGAMSLPLSRK